MAVKATYTDPEGDKVTRVFEGKGTTKKGVTKYLRSIGCRVSLKNVKIVTKAWWG